MQKRDFSLNCVGICFKYLVVYTHTSAIQLDWNWIMSLAISQNKNLCINITHLCARASIKYSNWKRVCKTLNTMGLEVIRNWISQLRRMTFNLRTGPSSELSDALVIWLVNKSLFSHSFWFEPTPSNQRRLTHLRRLTGEDGAHLSLVFLRADFEK